jgi:outer membrane protein assembly factor BamB
LQASIQQGIFYLGTGDGYVLALSDQGGRLSPLWRKRAGTGLQDITATPEGVLVTTGDNFVLLLESHRGKRLWKRQLPARIAASPSLGSGVAIFAPIGEDACIALSLRNGKVINSLPIGKDNSVIATPLLAGDFVFISTRKGLLAFAPAGKSPSPQTLASVR